MVTYRIRASFEARGERSYLIKAETKEEAYKKFSTNDGSIEPEHEEYEIEKMFKERDEVDIEKVED